MLLLASTSDKIRVTSSIAVALHVHASWVDLNGSTVTPNGRDIGIQWNAAGIFRLGA